MATNSDVLIYTTTPKEDFTGEDGVTYTHFENIDELEKCLSDKDISKISITSGTSCDIKTSQEKVIFLPKLTLNDQEDIKLFREVIKQVNLALFVKEKRHQAENPIKPKEWSEALRITTYIRFLLTINVITFNIPDIVLFINEWYILLWYGTNPNQRREKCYALGKSILTWVGNKLERFNYVTNNFYTLIQNLTTVGINLYRDITINIEPVEQVYLIIHDKSDHQAEKYLKERRDLFNLIKAIKWSESWCIINVNGSLSNTGYTEQIIDLTVNEIKPKIIDVVLQLLSKVKYGSLMMVESSDSGKLSVAKINKSNDDPGKLAVAEINQSTPKVFVDLTSEDCYMKTPTVHRPSSTPENYTVFIGSHRYDRVEKIRKKINHIVHLDGTMYPSFSKLVNDCVRSCPTEMFIFMSDRMDISQNEIDKIVSMLEAGYAFVSLYSFAFFGFKKELIRQIGFMDERFIGGGYEDHDFSMRIVEARLPYFSSEMLLSLYVIKNRTNWNYGVSNRFYYEKWKFRNGTTTRYLPDPSYDGSLGPKTNDEWYSDSCLIHDTVRAKVPTMAIYHIVRGRYAEGLDKYFVSKYEEFRNSEHDWIKLIRIVNVIIGSDTPMKKLNLDNNNVSLFVGSEEGNIEESSQFSTIIIPCYRPSPEILQLFIEMAPKLKIGGYIILHGWKQTSYYYDANIHEGQIYLAVEHIKKFEGYDVMVFPIHPGLCLVRRQV